MTVKVENFGCRLNALEGDSVEVLAEGGGSVRHHHYQWLRRHQ